MSGVILNKVVTDGLILCIDPANSVSYTSPNSTVNDLASTDEGSLGTLAFSTSALGSFYFDGTTAGSYISLSNRISFLELPEFSVDIWISPLSGSAAGGIFATSIVPPNVSYYGFIIQIGALSGGSFGINCSLGNGLGSGAGNRKTLAVSTGVTPDSWNHIVITCNVSLISSTPFQIYINGVLQTGGTYTGSATFISWGEEAAISITSIGRNWASDTLKFNGYISNTKMYNKILSQSEITQNYNATKKRFGL
jgi:hypothetical protein